MGEKGSEGKGKGSSLPFAQASSGSSFVSDAVRRLAGLVRLGGPAWLVVGASLALSLLSVYSIDVAESVKTHAESELGRAAMKQLFFLGIGMGAAVVVAVPHYRWL